MKKAPTGAGHIFAQPNDFFRLQEVGAARLNPFLSRLGLWRSWILNRWISILRLQI